jgi:hypothetical protein
MTEQHLTGGCQCGAVRYEWTVRPTHSSVCYCRMCQKASGQPLMGLTGGKREHLTWTRGKPAFFRSSNMVERGFCRDCGTPLFFRYIDRDRISLSLGSLDDPTRLAPAKQFGIESRLAFLAALTTLPGTRTEDDVSPADMARLKSRQHPDRPD